MRRLLIVTLLVLSVSCGSQPAPQAVSGPEPVAQSQNDELTVYITDTGTRYHLASCPHLKASKHAVPLADAKRRGYKPCKVCQPPK